MKGYFAESWLGGHVECVNVVERYTETGLEREELVMRRLPDLRAANCSRFG